MNESREKVVAIRGDGFALQLYLVHTELDLERTLKINDSK